MPGAAYPPGDGRCSALSRDAGEPRGGTAPHARVWVLLEQPGPWGRDAVHDSHLEPEVAETAGGPRRAGPCGSG